jgi:ATP phosphoribosyltransferase regulatory subunit HisZ
MSELKKLLPEYPISKNTTLGTVDNEAYGLHYVWLKIQDFLQEALERGYDYDSQLVEIYENDPAILLKD